MEMNKIHGKLIIAAIFLFLCHALSAQEVGYHIEYIDGKPKFIQLLNWESVEYALYYEVLIHALNNGEREYSKDATEDKQLLVSLPPGKYRYCVTPYDLLEVRGEPSEWKDFEVLPAYQPVISSFTPEIFYLDRILDRELRITGGYLFKESEIYLKSSAGNLYPDKIIINSEQSATLVFDDMKLEPGSYDIYVKNPGGLSTQSGIFMVGYRKPLDFFLKLAYTPLFPNYRENAGNIDPAISFAGLSFSFEVISSKRGDINGGLELAASLNYFDTDNIGIDEPEEDLLYTRNQTLYTSFALNIVLQKRFYRGRMAASFHFGIGGATVIPTDGIMIIKLNLGAEYMVRLYKTLYFEAGLDYNIDMSEDYPDYIKPRLGIVWQF